MPSIIQANDRGLLICFFHRISQLTLMLLLLLSVQLKAQTCDNANVPESTPDSRFEVVRILFGNTPIPFTIKDHKTGLEWFYCTSGGVLNDTCDNEAGTSVTDTYTWAEALALASNAQFGDITPIGASEPENYDSWRLPNVKELASIVELCNRGPSINETIFPNMQSGNYWSSSPYIVDVIGAWYVNFIDGNDSVSLKSNSNYVRLVRSEQ